MEHQDFVRYEFTPQIAERAYLVRRADVMCGAYPCAEPVVLVDLALAHRHPGVRVLELVSPPPTPEQAPSLATAIPIFVIDMREAMLYEGARPAVVVRDDREPVAVQRGA